MLTLDNTTLTALATPGCALTSLIEIDLAIPWRLNTAGMTLNYLSTEYIGVPPGIGSVDTISDVEGETRGLSFQLPALVSGELATAMNAIPAGAGVRVYTAVFNKTDTAMPIVYRRLEWAGRTDVPVIRRDRKTSIIALTAEHIGVDLLRPSGLLYSNADQQRLHPGDRSFEYVISNSRRRVVWPAASYYRK